MRKAAEKKSCHRERERKRKKEKKRCHKSTQMEMQKRCHAMQPRTATQLRKMQGLVMDQSSFYELYGGY